MKNYDVDRVLVSLLYAHTVYTVYSTIQCVSVHWLLHNTAVISFQHLDDVIYQCWIFILDGVLAHGLKVHGDASISVLTNTHQIALAHCSLVKQSIALITFISHRGCWAVLPLTLMTQ